MIVAGSWFVMFAAIFAIAVFARLGNSSRVGLLLLVALGLGSSISWKWRQGQAGLPHARHASSTDSFDVEHRFDHPPEKPNRPKRGPKPKPGSTSKAPPPPSVLASTVPVDRPPAPPLAEVATTSMASGAEAPTDVESPLTLFQGSSAQGRPVESLPGWVTELATAQPGSRSVSFSSERYATIERAEEELWDRARDFVAADLRARVPEAAEWSPPRGLLKSQGLVVERCIEKTALEVGSFVEPMYRVHWKASVTDDLRRSLVDAWRPSVQENRVELVAMSILGASGAFAFLNLILRSAAARVAARKPTATA